MKRRASPIVCWACRKEVAAEGGFLPFSRSPGLDLGLGDGTMHAQGRSSHSVNPFSQRYPGYASPISSMDFGLLFFLSVLLRAVSSAHPPVTVTVNGGSSLKVSFRVLWSQWWKANSSNVLMSSSSAFGWLAAHRGENLSGSIEATPTAYGESHGSSNWPLASHLAAME